MFQLDLKSRKSIYEQIVDNIKELIITGILKPEAKLPSVRELSKTLTVNPNTIQKAYRELEHQNYIYTVSGLGGFVCPPSHRRPDQGLIENIKELLRGNLMELFYLGLDQGDIQAILDKLFEERGEEK